MPTPPPSDPNRRGRPARPGGTFGKPGGARKSAGGSRRAAGARGGSGAGSEGPPWKRRAEARDKDDAKGKQAGWGGVARKGAGRLRDPSGSGHPPSAASDAFRAATGGAATWEPEQWIDEGEVRADVRSEARGAVGRGRSARRSEVPDDQVPDDPSLRRAVGAAKVERVEERLRDASRAFRRERYEEARRLLRPLAEAAPTAVSVRELLGLTYYRMGKWKLAVAQLEAFTDLTGSTEQHPVLADCYRALGRHTRVAELWQELRSVSPGASLIAEGRIVYAGSLADQGNLTDAIAVLEAAKPPSKHPQEHHLRVAYALADLYERAGDLPRARRLFGVVATADPDLGDVTARLRALR